MPSHTFTRVGFWQESIDANLASAAAARKDNAIAEELHALDYQAYAYLQTAQDGAARRTLDVIGPLGRQIQTRRRRQRRAAAGRLLRAAPPSRRATRSSATPGPRPPRSRRARRRSPRPTPSRTSRARSAPREAAISSPRPGEDIDRLDRAPRRARDGQGRVLGRPGGDPAARGDGVGDARRRPPAEALTLMREAADLEDATEKAAVTPGPIKPARELLGEMLLQLKRPAEALAEFEATMKKEPNRFRAHLRRRAGGQRGRPADEGGELLRRSSSKSAARRIDPAGKSWIRRAKRRGDVAARPTGPRGNGALGSWRPRVSCDARDHRRARRTRKEFGSSGPPALLLRSLALELPGLLLKAPVRREPTYRTNHLNASCAIGSGTVCGPSNSL